MKMRKLIGQLPYIKSTCHAMEQASNVDDMKITQ
jgi:hypothetical protein